MRAGLEEWRAAQRPVSHETVEHLVRIAQRGGPHPGLDELVESWRGGRTTWSILRTHPRMVTAQQERAEELLTAVRRTREERG